MPEGVRIAFEGEFDIDFSYENQVAGIASNC